MKGRGRGLVMVLFVAVGVLVFNYPTISSLVNDIFANREVSQYEASVKTMDSDELQRRVALAKEYNQSLPLSFPADPLSGSNINSFEGTAFEDFEFVQPGATIGYLEVPDIGVYQTVYYGTSDEVLGRGLGLVENTSLPVGGEGTHAVISGHTGLASRKLFTDLDKLGLGSLFFVHVLDSDFAYEVDQIKVVLPSETQDLAIQQGQELVTLLTCTPFGVNDHRLLVRGHRVDYDFTSAPQTHSPLTSIAPSRTVWFAALGGGFALMVLVVAKVRHDRWVDALPTRGAHFALGGR